MKPIITTRHYPPDYLKEITETLKLWTTFIKEKSNFSFIKIGDGEFYSMMGKSGANCDGHPFSRELGDKIIDAWNFFSTTNLPNIYLAEWGDQPGSFGTPQNIRPIKNMNNPVFQYFDWLMKQHPTHNFKLVNYEILIQNTLTEEKFQFYKEVKESKRKKIYVGPQRLEGVQGFLNTDCHIQIPLLNCFSIYDRLLEECKKQVENDCIFLFTCGMPSKSIIAELIKTKNNITCLDVGSGFDVLFHDNTREGQLDRQTVINFYRELL